MKEYDQCVTCLPDDLQNLVTRSSTLRTPGILSQKTIAYISNQAGYTGKTQIRRSNQKVQLKNSNLQKESNQTEQRNSNYKKQDLITNLD